MGFRAPHLFRVGRAVDPITGTVETNPREANWIVRAGWDAQTAAELLAFFRFREHFRVKSVVGLRDHDCDPKIAQRSLIHSLRDAAREMDDDSIRFIERLERALREKDSYARRLAGKLRWVCVGQPDFSPRRDGVPLNARIEAAHKALTARRWRLCSA